MDKPLFCAVGTFEAMSEVDVKADSADRGRGRAVGWGARLQGSALEDKAEIDGDVPEIVERFGRLPEVGLLMNLVQIKALCRRANVEELEAGRKGVTLAFRGKSFANPAALVRWVASRATAPAFAPTCASGDRRIRQARRPARGDAEDHARNRHNRGEAGLGQACGGGVFIG